MRPFSRENYGTKSETTEALFEVCACSLGNWINFFVSSPEASCKVKVDFLGDKKQCYWPASRVWVIQVMLPVPKMSLSQGEQLLPPCPSVGCLSCWAGSRRLIWGWCEQQKSGDFYIPFMQKCPCWPPIPNHSNGIRSAGCSAKGEGRDPDPHALQQKPALLLFLITEWFGWEEILKMS